MKHSIGIFIAVLLAVSLIFMGVGTLGVSAADEVVVHFGLTPVGYQFCKVADMSDGKSFVAGTKIEIKSEDGSTVYATFDITDDIVSSGDYVTGLTAKLPSWKEGDVYLVAVSNAPSQYSSIMSAAGESANLGGVVGGTVKVYPMTGDGSGMQKTNGTAEWGLTQAKPYNIRLLIDTNAVVVKMSDNGVGIEGINIQLLLDQETQREYTDKYGYAVFSGVDMTNNRFSVLTSTEYNGKKASALQIEGLRNGSRSRVVAYKYPDGAGDGSGVAGQQAPETAEIKVSEDTSVKGIIGEVTLDYRYDTTLIKKVVPSVELQLDGEAIASQKFTSSGRVSFVGTPKAGNYKLTSDGNFNTEINPKEFTLTEGATGKEVKIGVREAKVLSVSKQDAQGKFVDCTFAFKDNPANALVGLEARVNFGAYKDLSVTIIDLDTNKEYEVKILDEYPVTHLMLGDGKIVGEKNMPPVSNAPKTYDSTETVLVILGLLTILLVILIVVGLSGKGQTT